MFLLFIIMLYAEQSRVYEMVRCPSLSVCLSVAAWSHSSKPEPAAAVTVHGSAGR